MVIILTGQTVRRESLASILILTCDGFLRSLLSSYLSGSLVGQTFPNQTFLFSPKNFADISSLSSHVQRHYRAACGPSGSHFL